MIKQDPLIPIDALEMAATVLKVIAHPLRLRICELLIQHKQLTVSKLADLMSVPPNTISQHLKLMKAHGVVTAARDGRNVCYKSIHPTAATMIKCIRKNSGKF